MKTQSKNVAAPLTEEQTKMVAQQVMATWQIIGYDLLQANDGKSIPRAEVIECVLDADRLEADARTPEMKAALKAFRAFPYEAQKKLAGTALGPFKRFGL